jgi:hypothetical protein
VDRVLKAKRLEQQALKALSARIRQKEGKKNGEGGPLSMVYPYELVQWNLKGRNGITQVDMD